MGRLPGSFRSEPSPTDFAVSNLAARDRRTVAIGDIREEPALDDPTLGGIETLLELDSRAVLATPVLVFDRMIGVFGLHRAEPGAGPRRRSRSPRPSRASSGIAIHAAQLLDENAQRLEQQTALLKAAQVVTSELRLETVLQRLVVEVTKLLDADAADCYLYDADNRSSAARPSTGSTRSWSSFEFPAERSVDARFDASPCRTRRTRASRARSRRR